MSKEYMYKSQWVVFNNKGNRIKTVTLKHKDGAIYKELEPFEKELKSKGLYAHKKEVLDQEFLKGKNFIEKLKLLGWEFNKEGYIIGNSVY